MEKHSESQILQSPGDPIYLNVILLNKGSVNYSLSMNRILVNIPNVIHETAAVVQEKVKEKTKFRPGGFLEKAATFAANKMVTDETVVNNLASNLKEKIEHAVSEMGITAVVTKQFQKGSFVVMKMVITEVDKLTLILAAKGEEFASLFSTLVSTLHALGLGEEALPRIDSKIQEQVHTAMMRKLAEMIPMRMSEAGLEVDCHVLGRNDQTEFFFDALSRLESERK